jgi:hypothetical protein
MQALAVAIALSSLTPDPAANLAFFDGPRLVDTCLAKGDVRAAKQSVCLGYVAGAIDQLMMQQAQREAGDRTICPPPELSLNGVVHAILERSNSAAAGRGRSAAALVKIAMEASFPCRRDADIM